MGNSTGSVIHTPLKGGAASGMKESATATQHFMDMTPMIPSHKFDHRFDYGAQTQKIKSGMSGKQALLKSAPMPEQLQDNLQHSQMF